MGSVICIRDSSLPPLSLSLSPLALSPRRRRRSNARATLMPAIADRNQKHPGTELQGVLHFLVAQLHKGKGLELLVLNELLAKVRRRRASSLCRPS